MPLQTQHIEVPLVGGIDTKTAQQVVQPPQVLELSNADMSEPGKIKRRAGHTALAKDTAAGGSVSSGDKLLATDKALLLMDGGTYYRRVEAHDEWKQGGYLGSVRSSAEVVFAQSNLDHHDATVAHANGVTVYAYTDNNTSDGYYRVYDEETGSLLLAGEFTGECPKLVVSLGYFLLFYVVSTTECHVRTADSTNITSSSFGTATTLFTDIDTGSVRIGVAVRPSSLPYVAYVEDSGFDLAVRLISNVTGTPAAGPAATAAMNDRAVAVAAYWHDGLDRLVAACCRYFNTGGIFWATFDATPTVDDSGDFFSADYVNVSLSDGAASDQFAAFIEQSAASGTGKAVRCVPITPSTGAMGTQSETSRYGLGHDAVALDGRVYVGLVWDTDLESVYITASWPMVDGEPLTPVAKYLSPVGGGLLQSGRISQVAELSDGRFLWATNSKTTVRSDDGEIRARLSLSKCTFDTNADENYRNTLAGGSLFLSGGVPHVYEGSAWADLGFLHAPPPPDLTEQSGGSLTATGTYSYVFVFEWRSPSGRVYRSPVSVATSITLTSSNQSVQMDVPGVMVAHERLSDDFATHPVLAIYRTTDGGSTYYRVSDFDEPTCLATSSPGTFTDDASDSSIEDNEILYTTGGELDHYAPPPTLALAEHQERIWCVNSEDGSLWPSARVQPSEGPWWHPALAVQTSRTGKKPTALASMDDKLVIFWEDAIGYLYGEGPGRNGSGAQFSPIFPIPSDVGCTDARSVVVTPDGVMFQSSRGIYLLGRGMQVQYVGAPVEGFNNLTVVAASLVPEKHEVRFRVGSGGTALVYEYLLKQWWTEDITKSAAWVDSVLYDGSEHALSTAADVLRRDSAVTQDDGDSYFMEIVTAWFKLDGLLGYQRVRRVWLLGKFTPGVLGTIIQAGYDGNATWSNIRAPDDMTGSEEEVRVHVPNQKCRSIRFRVLGATELTSIRLEVGTKKGGYKPVDKRL